VDAVGPGARRRVRRGVDLGELSRAVRQVLDAGGLQATRIFASGDLDEWKIAALVAAGAPIDAFGVGTRLATSFDEPAVGGVYKLVELKSENVARGKVKTSPGKATFPGRKQVWRQSDASGTYVADVVAGADEPAPAESEPLLSCVMRAGARVQPAPPLAEVRARCHILVGKLPVALTQLETGPAYPVRFSDRLKRERERLVAAESGR
jgi:nicotinate phosphoribosyltransferase